MARIDVYRKINFQVFESNMAEKHLISQHMGILKHKRLKIGYMLFSAHDTCSVDLM